MSTTPTPDNSSPPKEYFQVFAVIEEHFPEEFNLDDSIVRDLVGLIDAARTEERARKIELVMPSKKEILEHTLFLEAKNAGYRMHFVELDWLRVEIERRSK